MDVDSRIILIGSVVLGVVLLAYKKEHILVTIIYIFCALAVAMALSAFIKVSSLSPEEYRQHSPFRDSLGFWLDVVIVIPLMLSPPFIYHKRRHMVSVWISIYKIHHLWEKTMLNIYKVFCLVVSSAMFCLAKDFFIGVA